MFYDGDNIAKVPIAQQVVVEGDILKLEGDAFFAGYEHNAYARKSLYKSFIDL